MRDGPRQAGAWRGGTVQDRRGRGYSDVSESSSLGLGVPTFWPPSCPPGTHRVVEHERELVAGVCKDACAHDCLDNLHRVREVALQLLGTLRTTVLRQASTT
eukprot:351138-Chlamydomonas_euryale.AAC.12